MPGILKTRWCQGYRTMPYPQGPPPELPERFVGRPIIDPSSNEELAPACIEACPFGAPQYNAERDIVRACKLANLDATYCEIESSYGHDAFLLETDEETYLIKHFLERVLNGHTSIEYGN